LSDDARDVGLELERASALCELRRFEEAIELLQQLLAREPDSAPAWCLLAQAQLGVGDAYAALDAAGHAIALEPDEEWPHRLRSIAFEQLGVTDSAIGAAREAARVGPYSWRAHSGLATALVIKRDLDEAWAAAERGAALAPHEPDTHYALGLVANARGNHREAEEHFRQALALNPQHGPAHNALASRQFAASRRFNPDGLAAAAAGFRNVVQADPRAHYGAANLEATLRFFLARLSYLILVMVFIAARAHPNDSLAARILPPLLAVVPLAYAARFLARLEPDLRSRLFYIASHGRLGAASIAQVCAVVSLLAAAVPRANSNAQAFCLGAAFVSALTARGLVYWVRRTSK
jgi:tetratricopeptide (TPR) repeat protein